MLLEENSEKDTERAQKAHTEKIFVQLKGISEVTTATREDLTKRNNITSEKWMGVPSQWNIRDAAQLLERKTTAKYWPTQC
jgi:hypothetical protein